MLNDIFSPKINFGNLTIVPLPIISLNFENYNLKYSTDHSTL